MDLKAALQRLIKGEVIDDPQKLDLYSKDASIFEVQPQVVVAPKDKEDLKSLVKFCDSHSGVSLTPRSGGTDMGGGPLSDSIVLDMTRYFNRIFEVGSDFAATQPGVYYRDFEKASLKKGLLLPCYTASKEICTVGGMVANNSAGEKTLTYGQTERWVSELKVVLSDGNEYIFKPLTKSELERNMKRKDFEGEIYQSVYELITQNSELLTRAKPQVSKNSSGYYLWNVWDQKTQTFDLTKLIVGSQGTLGIITEIKFKLMHPSTHSKLLVIFLPDLKNLAKIVRQVLIHKPESFESYDDYTLKIATRYIPELLRIMKPANIFSLALHFIPELIMALTSGFPKLVLITEFSGHTEEEVEKKCLDAQNSLKEFNLKSRITTDEVDRNKYWAIRRESFNLLRHHAQNLRTAPFIDDVVVKPANLPEFLPKLQSILRRYKLIYTIAGHVGDGNFHIIPLMDFRKPETPEIILELTNQVFKLVKEYKGSFTAEHNDGLIRSPYLTMMYGEKIYQLFKEVKGIFDPKNIFNPHKKTDGTFEYSFNNIVDHHNQLHPTGS